MAHHTIESGVFEYFFVFEIIDSYYKLHRDFAISDHHEWTELNTCERNKR